MKYSEPAFPCKGKVWIYDPITESTKEAVDTYHEGLSIRDYFACSAMNAELISSGSQEGPATALVNAAKSAGITIEARIAQNAYSLADAMLAERVKE